MRLMSNCLTFDPFDVIWPGIIKKEQKPLNSDETNVKYSLVLENELN